MRTAFALVVSLLAMSAGAVRAEPPKLAVFDLELIDTSLQGEMNGPRTDEQARLLRAGDQVRKELADSGKFRVLDIAPVNAAAHGSNLQACGGCDVKLAGGLGVYTGVLGPTAVLAAGVDTIMLDNFSPAELRAGVELVAGRAVVEASGGVSLETIGAIAATGVDVISVGALTHTVRSLDLGLDAVVEEGSPRR